MSEEKRYYIDCINNDELVVKEFSLDNGKVVSEPFKVVFMLCSHRCLRKQHFGSFSGGVFECDFYEQMLKKVLGREEL